VGIQNEISYFSLYPIPTLNLLTINGSISGYTIALHNQFGQLMIRKIVAEKETSIDLEAYVDGVYWLTITDGQDLTKYKIIKTS
jgi:hypothetical protein